MAYSGSSATHANTPYNHYQHSATIPLRGASTYPTGPYGGFGAIAAPAPNQKLNAVAGVAFDRARQRRRLDVCSIFLALFGPWMLFVVMFFATSFSLQYNHPYFCYLVIAAGLIVVLILLLFAVDIHKKKKQGQGMLAPTWIIFVFITCMLMWCAGTIAGNVNFAVNTRNFYDFQSLNTYLSVDPAVMHGEQVMDGGRVDFVETARLDVSKAMGFKNGETYCVAPVTSVPPGNTTSMVTYDFWAVGKNCCLGPDETDAKGQGNDYHCGVFLSPQAHGGIRLMDDADRPFYRLAVQQAEAAYGIKAAHPLFFDWTINPVEKVNALHDAGKRCFMLGAMTAFVVQLFLVLSASMAFSRLH